MSSFRGFRRCFITTKLVKGKSKQKKTNPKTNKTKRSVQQTPTSTILKCRLSTRFSTCGSGHQPAHGTWLQTNTHAHTHAHTLAYTGPAHLCRTPPPLPRFPVYCSGPFAVRLWSCWWGGGELSVGCGEVSGTEGWRGGARRKRRKMKRPEGPQLASAMVSMTCSSLLLSLCLLACSSRSSADRICRRGGEGRRGRGKGQKVSGDGRVPREASPSTSPRPCT